MQWACTLSVLHDQEVNTNLKINDAIQYLIARYDKYEESAGYFLIITVPVINSIRYYFLQLL